MAGKAGRSGRKKQTPEVAGVGLDPMSDLAPPDWLGEVAAAKWGEIVAELVQIDGLVANIDRDIIGLFCEAFEEYTIAASQLGGDYVCTGATGGAYQNPLVGIKNKAAERMRLLSDKLGMSPAARTALKIRPAPKVNAEMERFAKIYNMRNYKAG